MRPRKRGKTAADKRAQKRQQDQRRSTGNEVKNRKGCGPAKKRRPALRVYEELYKARMARGSSW